MEKSSWLINLAEIQKENIADYVKIDKFFFLLIDKTSIPFVIFRFRVFNKSVFEVTLEKETEGHIAFRNETLQGDKQFVKELENKELENIEPSGYKWFDFKYRLRPEEVDFLSNVADISENDFEISNLILMIKGSKKCLQIISKKVNIRIHSKVWNYKEYEKAIEPYSHI